MLKCRSHLAYKALGLIPFNLKLTVCQTNLKGDETSGIEFYFEIYFINMKSKPSALIYFIFILRRLAIRRCSRWWTKITSFRSHWPTNRCLIWTFFVRAQADLCSFKHVTWSMSYVWWEFSENFSPPGRRNFERSSLVPHFGSIRYISF